MTSRIETLQTLKTIITTHLHHHNFFSISTQLLLADIEVKLEVEDFQEAG